MGFVNAKWDIRGILKKSASARVHTDGQTYDSKLHTFREMNYKKAWKALEVTVSKENAEALSDGSSSDDPDINIPEITDAPSSRLPSSCCSNPFQPQSEGSKSCLIF
jgi:hypothetical protein